MRSQCRRSAVDLDAAGEFRQNPLSFHQTGFEFDRWLNTPGWPPYLPDLSPGDSLMKPAEELAHLWVTEELDTKAIEAVAISAWKTYQLVYFLDKILQQSPLPPGKKKWGNSVQHFGSSRTELTVRVRGRPRGSRYGSHPLDAPHGEHVNGWSKSYRPVGRGILKPRAHRALGLCRDSAQLLTWKSWSPPNRSLPGGCDRDPPGNRGGTCAQVGPAGNRRWGWDLEALSCCCRVAAQPEITFTQGCWRESESRGNFQQLGGGGRKRGAQHVLGGHLCF